MDRFWGKMLDRIQMLDEQVVWMQFPAEKEAKEVMERATRVESSSPFFALEKWMECPGYPPRPCWLKINGVPLHAWPEDVFNLLGGCLGRTVEVDENH